MNFMSNLKENYNKITVKLFLHRVFRHGVGTFYLENINENFCNIVYLEKTDVLLKIDMNNDNISSNFKKINTNKSNIKNNDTDIAYNLKQINLIKNDISKLKSNKIYSKNLDNLYNLIFRGYNYTISYNQAIPFYKKTFNFSFKKIIL